MLCLIVWFLLPKYDDILTSEVERLACDQVVEGVVVEGGNVCWFPDLVLETVSELVL